MNAIPNQRTVEYSYPMPVPLGTFTGYKQAIGGDAVFVYYVITESTGAAPAVIQFIDGGDANGVLLGQINLLAGQSVNDQFGPFGVVCRAGVGVNVISGSVLAVVGVIDL